MKNILSKIILAAVLLTFSRAGLAADSTSAEAAATKDAKAQLSDLVGRINEKLRDNKRSETDLAAELKEFDTLLADHKEEKTDDVAQILFMKAMLFVEVLEDYSKGTTFLKQLKSDFPETQQGKRADEILASVQKREAAKKIQRQLAVGSAFPDFEEKDLAGKPLSIANYKGKVVLLDFWATWCGPCVAELPNVLKAYEKYHSKGFEILGISLDKDEKALTDFTKKREMPWQQFFDGKGWENKLAVKYGVGSIPATYLLDGAGKIVAKDLRGEALATELKKLLEKP